MIFAGDVAIAPDDTMSLEGFPDVVARQPWVINMEGPVAPDDVIPDWGTCNTPAWRDTLGRLNIAAASLANNHISDRAGGIATTTGQLREQGVQPFGAGVDAAEAGTGIRIEDDGVAYVLVGFGWELVGCRARAGDGVINRLDGAAARASVASLVAQNPDARVVPVIHWNYELEHYPQPGHRLLARQLIDAGAHAVVGHHPHVAGPVETWHGRTIAHSVGNLAFSYGRFFGGRNRLPATTFHEVALELGRDGDRLHHMRFDPAGTVAYRGSEDVAAADFSFRPAFADMGHREYVRWFRANRVKKRLLPIYSHPDASAGNAARDGWMALRQRLVDAAGRHGLKRMHHAG